MNSNLTPAEQWRLHGRFTDETAHHLLDLSEHFEDLDKDWASSALDEVHSCIPKEDVLTDALRDLALLVKSTRGVNKDRAQDLFNELHALAEQLRQDAEHAHEQLNNVQNKLNKLGI